MSPASRIAEQNVRGVRAEAPVERAGMLEERISDFTGFAERGARKALRFQRSDYIRPQIRN